MIKALEHAVDKVKGLSRSRQELAAELLELVADGDDGLYQMSEDEQRLVQEGLAGLDRGEAASDAEVRAVFDKYRK